MTPEKEKLLLSDTGFFSFHQKNIGTLMWQMDKKMCTVLNRYELTYGPDCVNSHIHEKLEGMISKYLFLILNAISHKDINIVSKLVIDIETQLEQILENSETIN